MHYFKITMFSIILCNLINFKLSIFKSTGAVNTTLVIPRLVSASRLYEYYQTVIFTGINRKARHLSARLSSLSPWILRPTYQIHLHPLFGLTNVFTPYTFPLVLITMIFFKMNAFPTHFKMCNNDDKSNENMMHYLIFHNISPFQISLQQYSTSHFHFLLTMFFNT